MSIDKPPTAEEEYFLREEAARRQREAIEKARYMEQAERERLQQLHYMKCPKCGFDLHEITLRGVAIDKCEHCAGIWLDDQELEKITTATDHNLFDSIASVFKRSSKK